MLKSLEGFLSETMGKVSFSVRNRFPVSEAVDYLCSRMIAWASMWDGSKVLLKLNKGKEISQLDIDA